MPVTAFSTPSRPNWRWRIVHYEGETIEDAHDAAKRDVWLEVSE